MTEEEKYNIDLDELAPTDHSMIEKKLENSDIHRRVFLFAYSKIKQTPASFTTRDVKKHFKIDHSWAYRIIDFFVDNDLVKKIRRGKTSHIYKPIEAQMKPYWDLAYKKFKGEL